MARVNTGSGWTALNTTRALNDGAGTVINTATPNIARVDLATDITLTGSVKTGGSGGAIHTSARLATVAALPACTYNNGASGVGATLTGNANGQVADIDYVTPAVNDRILVCYQAAAAQNGLYIVTQLGDAGTPFILTRAATADTDTDFTNGVVVDVTQGQSMTGVMFTSRPTSTTANPVTVGTTLIRFDGIRRANVTPADWLYGTTRYERRYCVDFEEVPTTAITTTGTGLSTMGGGSVNLSGTGAQAIQDGTADNLPGVIKLSTGTTTTGYATVQLSTNPFTFDVNKPVGLYVRAKTGTLSDATNTYLVRFGFMPNLTIGAGGATLASGLYFQARSATNWEAVSLHGSVSNGTTPNGLDTGTSQLTAYRSFFILYDPVTQAAKFYIGANLVATVTTQLPSADVMGIGFTIVKQAGTTSRDLSVDMFVCNVPDTRSLPAMIP